MDVHRAMTVKGFVVGTCSIALPRRSSAPLRAGRVAADALQRADRSHD